MGYIMETIPIVKLKDANKYGEYCAIHIILECYCYGRGF
jgi:hypothetical protein